MAWFWTDDLARRLIEAGDVRETEVRDWMVRPVAFAGPEDADPVEFALGLLGRAREVA